MNNANTAQAMYALSINQTADLIEVIGSSNSTLVQGNMGTGKTSLLHILAARLPTHTPCYIDGTTLVDGADMFMVKYSTDGKTFNTVPLEDLGLHTPDRPMILMFDELGKMTRSAQLATLQVQLERKHGKMTLHPDSIVFSTTNLGSEGVGDLLPAHA